MLRALRQMLQSKCPDASGARGQSALGVHIAEGEDTVTTEQLMRVLHRLQRQPVEDDLALALRVREAVGTELGRISDDGVVAPRLQPRDADVIEVMGLLFEVMFDEQRDAPAVRALLARLQVPALKVALIDPSFFPEGRHPARRLINEVARAGAEEADSAEWMRVEGAVARVVDEFDHDLALFTRVLDSLDVAAEKERDETEQMLEQLRRRELHERIRREITAELDSGLRGRRLPGSLQALLYGPWTTVLTRTRLEAPEGPLWTERRALVDELLWSVSAQPDTDARHRLATAIPRILRVLGDGLAAIGYPPDRIEVLSKELEPLHMAALSGDAPSPDGKGAEPTTELGHLIAAMESQIASLSELEAIFEPHTDDAGSSALAMDAEQHPGPEDSRYLEAARQLPIGAWVDFAADGKSRRARLAWRSELLEECVFVDRRFRTVEKNLRRFARDLEQGVARISEEGPLMDRAVNALLGRLRRRNPAVS